MTDENTAKVHLAPGDVVWIDADWLKQTGRCWTNSQKSEFDVEGEHFFLLIGRLVEEPHTFLAAALLSNLQPDSKSRRRLDSTLKQGPGDRWRNVDSRIYRFQTWKVPEDLLLEWIQKIRYSARSYADGKPEVIKAIEKWMDMNDNAWHRAVPASEKS